MTLENQELPLGLWCALLSYEIASFSHQSWSLTSIRMLIITKKSKCLQLQLHIGLWNAPLMEAIKQRENLSQSCAALIEMLTEQLITPGLWRFIASHMDLVLHLAANERTHLHLWALLPASQWSAILIRKITLIWFQISPPWFKTNQNSFLPKCSD